MQLPCTVLIACVALHLSLAEQLEEVVASDCGSRERGAAFVQHKSHVKHRSGVHARGPLHPVPGAAEGCRGDSLRDFCRGSDRASLYQVRAQNPSTKLHPVFSEDEGAELLAEVEKQDPDFFKTQKKARNDFEALRHVDARHVLAFRETWTSEDTRMLLAMDRFPEGWTQGKFSEEKFRSYLPSISLLEDYLDRGTGAIAIVGGGPSVAGHGGLIDAHPVVVRFNDHVGKTLVAGDTGRKMTVHVLNKEVDFQNEKNVLHIDLESSLPGVSMCKRWHQSWAHSELPGDQLTLLLRPSAVCALGGGLDGFTRGFLFYWLVGRYFQTVDMYGMSDADGTWHYEKPHPMHKQTTEVVKEVFLSFEHHLYKAARTLRHRHLEAERNKTLAADKILAESSAPAEGASGVANGAAALAVIDSAATQAAGLVATTSNVTNASTSTGLEVTTTTEQATSTPQEKILNTTTSNTELGDPSKAEEDKPTIATGPVEKGFAAAHQCSAAFAFVWLLHALWHL
mmetsp:Transcript_25445/g.58625  ORF Transcript_25445/g.58625 Transcript_25445/m.58625 type:complete len:511 (+) Transcript_25445:59-1591(+)